jgi:D-erythronate 2-dehydrogenase
MKVVITGGTGFLGLHLARRLLERPYLTLGDNETRQIDSIVLADAHQPPVRPGWMDERIELINLEITDRDAVFALIDRPDLSVFHLAAIVSAQAEADLDLALKVNIDAGLNVLNALRSRGGHRVVVASSYAVFGGELPDVCDDRTKLTPESTYGMTKAVLELLVNDYTRRGLVDGRLARLPTVIIRPGAANAAASSVASAIFREPLNGVAYEVPVPLDTRIAIAGVNNVIEGLIALHEVKGAQLGSDRSVTFPSTSHSIGEMVESLKRVAGSRPLGPISVRPNQVIQAIVSSWPQQVDPSRAIGIGVPVPDNLDLIVRSYLAETADAAAR